jgi:UDP-N-acetylglucosamine 2-epimerase (non-hydrolysing)
MKKLMVVFGTRPEVIKLAPVVVEARARAGVELLVCSTGQHRQMLDQALNCFGIHPDIELSLMRASQTLPTLTAALIESMSQTLAEQRPQVVIVQGDTTTAFAAALAAFYQRIPVAHVEAGLRTGDRYSPFPEEANRGMIARLAQWHFTPTPQAGANLQAEGIPANDIVACGNTVIDAIGLIQAQWRTRPYQGDVAHLFADRDLVLVTTHRRENFGQGLENICSALQALCTSHPELGFVFPVHLNPQVQNVVHERLAGISNLVYLQSRSRLILTDSGGIQEEAPSFGVPSVVMRQHTERQEGIDAGFATLAGTETQAIVDAAEHWLRSASLVQGLKHRANPYGDGQAARRILDALLRPAAGAAHAG